MTKNKSPEAVAARDGNKNELIEMPKGLLEVLKSTFDSLPSAAFQGMPVANLANLHNALGLSRIYEENSLPHVDLPD